VWAQTRADFLPFFFVREAVEDSSISEGAIVDAILRKEDIVMVVR
jgi:hypothetical protein